MNTVCDGFNFTDLNFMTLEYRCIMIAVSYCSGFNFPENSRTTT